jgi:hypothetical protein
MSRPCGRPFWQAQGSSNVFLGARSLGSETVCNSSKGSVVNHLRSLSWCVFVLSFLPSLAVADEPSLVAWTQQRVEAGILKPLAQRSSRFSRLAPPPQEQRVRVTQPTVSRDPQGRDFVPFAVDFRFGDSHWQTDDIVGCAYRASGKLFVKRGDAYFPAAVLLGKKVGALAGVCQAAEARS